MGTIYDFIFWKRDVKFNVSETSAALLFQRISNLPLSNAKTIVDYIHYHMKPCPCNIHIHMSKAKKKKKK